MKKVISNGGKALLYEESSNVILRDFWGDFSDTQDLIEDIKTSTILWDDVLKGYVERMAERLEIETPVLDFPEQMIIDEKEHCSSLVKPLIDSFNEVYEKYGLDCPRMSKVLPFQSNGTFIPVYELNFGNACIYTWYSLIEDRLEGATFMPDVIETGISKCKLFLESGLE